MFCENLIVTRYTYVARILKQRFLHYLVIKQKIIFMLIKLIRLILVGKAFEPRPVPRINITGKLCEVPKTLLRCDEN